MIKHIFAILLLSVLVVLFMPYGQQGLHFMVAGEEWVANLLIKVFSNDEAGNLIRQVLSLLAIPIVIALVPTILYWLAKRGWFPYFVQLVWILWLVQTAAVVIMHHTPVVG